MAPHTDRSWRWPTEISGAVGDLGITIPLAYALSMTTGLPAGRIFLLWGLAYILTGAYYRVPVSIQPLKVMAVIMIAGGIPLATLSTAAVAYGLLFLLLAATGVVPLIRRAFSEALVRGVQLGIGLMLGRKAFSLVMSHPFLLQGAQVPAWVTPAVAALVLGLLVHPRLRSRPGVVLGVIVGGVAVGMLVGRPLSGGASPGSLLAWSRPQWRLLADAFFLLMLPQLPLTLGNAVIAEEDVCRLNWAAGASRVSVAKLAGSIGLLDLGIGLLGGFPVCHGAGGSMAHARFGGRTGRTTILLGSVLVLLAVVPHGTDFMFLIPVPVLGALLLGVSWGMIRLLGSLRSPGEMGVGLTVGVVGFFTHNLALALAAGWILQVLLKRLFGSLMIARKG